MKNQLQVEEWEPDRAVLQRRFASFKQSDKILRQHTEFAREFI